MIQPSTFEPGPASGVTAAARGTRWLRKFGSPKLAWGPHVARYAPDERAEYERRAGRGHITFRNDASYVHECGHKLEDDNRDVTVRAFAFREQRTAGEQAQRLADLKPGRGYRDDEMSRPDKLMHPYMGKLYPGSKDTELTAMGVQYLYEGKAEKMLREDPEYFYFVLGQLAG